jgi:pimeloyl-ACP methyl ester carboxylesterase
VDDVGVPTIGEERLMEIDINGLSFAVDVRGPDDGTPVVLLHGWPDRGALWNKQIPALNDAGFRTIAPDLRGFGDSAKPEAVDQYNLLLLAGDVLGIMDRLGVAKAHVVGHDWGAALSWAIAGFMPDRVDQLVAMSVAHPSAFRVAGLAQRRLSWYMLLFQFEGVAEQWLAMDDWANLRDFASGHGDIAQVIADASRPGALTAGLSWYRANVPPESLVAPAIDFPPIAAETLGIWSSGDDYLLEEPMKQSGAFVSGGFRYERIDGASHWMQLDAAGELNRLVLGFLRP